MSYDLYQDDGTIASNFVSIYNGVLQVEYQVTGLTPGLQYRFKTTATNAIGESDFSNEMSWYAAALPT